MFDLQIEVVGSLYLVNQKVIVNPKILPLSGGEYREGRVYLERTTICP